MNLADSPGGVGGQKPGLYLDFWDEHLLCPWCGEGCTHIDEVSFGARHEDRPVNIATFDAIAGTLRLGGTTEVERSDRRHWIELHVDCETCAGGTIVLSQHKGVTHLSLLSGDQISLRDVVANQSSGWRADFGQRRPVDNAQS